MKWFGFVFVFPLMHRQPLFTGCHQTLKCVWGCSCSRKKTGLKMFFTVCQPTSLTPSWTVFTNEAAYSQQCLFFILLSFTLVYFTKENSGQLKKKKIGHEVFQFGLFSWNCVIQVEVNRKRVKLEVFHKAGALNRSTLFFTFVLHSWNFYSFFLCISYY